MIKHAVQYVFHTMQVILVILMKRFMQNLLKRQSNEKNRGLSPSKYCKNVKFQKTDGFFLGAYDI